MKMRHRMLLIAMLAAPVLSGGACTAAGQAEHEAHAAQPTPAGDVPLYDDLGAHHFAITTEAPLAQRYFDQGLRLYYAFNHAEARRAFAEAERLDPTCAMCAWGVAMTHGPNINARMEDAAVEPAFDALTRAVERSVGATALERGLIQALSTRYAPAPVADRSPLDEAYAQTMREVVRRHPESTEAAVLYAEAIMDLSPWDYWQRDRTPKPATREALGYLERTMTVQPDHPGACHFFIHAVEAVEPQRAVPCAERLAGLMPGAGHLVHMPGHIYIRVGRYADAIAANEHAVHADETYIQDQRPGVGLYTAGYYPHNYDFLAFAAAMVGRSAQAIDAAERVQSLMPKEMLMSGEAAFLQHYVMRPLQQRVRFGRWDEVLATPAPDETLPHSTGLWHFARGVAHAATGDLAAAERDLQRLRTIAESPELEGVYLEFNEARSILRIGVGVLEGRIAFERGRFADAEHALRRALQTEDDLVYGEPPEWLVPVRQELGTLLLVAGDPRGAERAFTEDLERHPENGWSLFGLTRALQAQGRMEEAAAAERRFREAWVGADVEITSPRL